MLKVKHILTALLLLIITNSFSQPVNMPAIVKKNGHYSILVDGKPFFMLGGQVHNSSAWAAMLPQVWLSVEKMHLNTLEVPVYWEQLEPQQGSFDFSLVDTLLLQARKYNVRLVPLWFATWKNGSNHYMPAWMKLDASKYPNITGISGKPVDSPSPVIDATLQADKKAFAALMHHLKKADAQHTVIMMQIENESGSWGSVRDYSAAAQKLFEGAVPDALLKPEVLKQLNIPAVNKGSWQQVFGNNADEYFHAWSVAHFVGQVAVAGKAEYPLPMYVNAALRDPLTNPPATNYESGGPTDNVIPIWKAGAPAIDLVAPDIYLSGSDRILKVIDLYNRDDNALFVPEAGLNALNVKYLYEVIARGGIGFSPFGIDNNGGEIADAELNKQLHPFAQEYAMMAPMMRELAAWSAEEKIKAVVEREDHAAQIIDLGAWQAVVSFGGAGRGSEAPHNEQPTGKAMIIQLDENKFILIGTLCHFSFRPTGNNANKAWQYLNVNEGYYENGSFKLLRIRNGDETDWGGPAFGDKPAVLQITLVLR